jgi:hypothetical protein
MRLKCLVLIEAKDKLCCMALAAIRICGISINLLFAFNSRYMLTATTRLV